MESSLESMEAGVEPTENRSGRMDFSLWSREIPLGSMKRGMTLRDFPLEPMEVS